MSARDRNIVVVIAVAALVIGSWVLLIQPRRSQASKLATQVSSVQAQLAAARSQVAQGQSARARFAADYATLARLGEAVPADDNVPSLIVQLQAAASATRVDFRSLTLSGSTGSTTSTSTATGGGAAPGATLPPGVTVGPAGFPVEPFTFTFRGNFFHLAGFFGRLERFVVATNRRVAISGRLMTLNAISLAPSSQGFPMIDATVSATTYLVPAAQGVLAGATPAGPSSSAAQSVSSSSGTGSTPPTAAITP